MEPEQATGRVLVVDDDETIRTVFSTALRLEGLEPVAAGDGLLALEILATDAIDAVLLDTRMPHMDGLAVLRAMRARPQSRTLPVILVTGQAEVADRVRGLEAGANDYLVKPVDLAELVARVKAQLRGQAAWMRLLEGQLRERATVIEALCRLHPEPTPELTAGVICAELARLRNLGSAVLMAFTDDGGAVPLACQGRIASDVRVGSPISSVLAARLRERAMHGAWTERRGTQPPGAAGPPLLGAHAEAAAYAPMISQGRMLGVLALTSGAAAADAPTDETAQALSAAIDFAAVSAALLGPALMERFEVGSNQSVLRNLLDTQAFRPVFQPIVDLRSGETVGYETLTRFSDGTEPQRRFTEAAQIGMGIDLERATMRAALEAASGRIHDGWLSLNVSPTFLATGEAERVTRDSDDDLDLVLELTEHDPISDYDDIHRAVRRLGGSIRLSIDDAGAGYACLTHVLTLQPAFVKLDRGWVMGIDADPARQALVAGLESFAVRTGCTLIAEGIETEAELDTVRGLGVDLGQGFLIGRPVPVQALARTA